MALVETPINRSCFRSTSAKITSNPTWSRSLTPPPRRLNRSDPENERGDILAINSHITARPSTLEGLDAWNDAVDALAKTHTSTMSNHCGILDKQRVSFDDKSNQNGTPGPSAHFCNTTYHHPHDYSRHTSTGAVGTTKPFQKWMKTLHRRAASRAKTTLTADQQAWCMTFSEEHASRSHVSTFQSYRRGSSSDSSFAGFVSAVKSAGSSLANVSLLTNMTKSRKNTIRSRRTARTDRSSKASVSGPRRSEESGYHEAILDDEPAIERALQRRKILEELISTEESYIGDVRFLMNVGTCGSDSTLIWSVANRSS